MIFRSLKFNRKDMSEKHIIAWASQVDKCMQFCRCTESNQTSACSQGRLHWGGVILTVVGPFPAEKGTEGNWMAIMKPMWLGWVVEEIRKSGECGRGITHEEQERVPAKGQMEADHRPLLHRIDILYSGKPAEYYKHGSYVINYFWKIILTGIQ